MTEVYRADGFAKVGGPEEVSGTVERYAAERGLDIDRKEPYHYGISMSEGGASLYLWEGSNGKVWFEASVHDRAENPENARQELNKLVGWLNPEVGWESREVLEQ